MVVHELPPPAAETAAPAPLLPRLFTRPASHLAFWVLPMALLLLLNLRGYWIVEGNMSPDERAYAHLFGMFGAVSVACGVGLYMLARRASIAGRSVDSSSAAWGIPGLVLHVAYLWIATSWADQMLPRSVVIWIYPAEKFLFHQLSFAMVPLAVGVLRVACARPPRHLAGGVAASLGIGVGAPVLFYLLGTALATTGAIGWPVLAVFLVGLGLAMFIGIIRTLMLVLHGARSWGRIGERVTIVLVALVMPLGGLLLNREIPFPVDLQAWEVYTLVAANTLILLLASWKSTAWPGTSFRLLCASLPFTLYFFVVFLPYTPLSILAVLAVGLGFLVLTPTFLFTLHLHLLQRAWLAARVRAGDRPPWRLVAGAVTCFVLLPAFFLVRAVADRAALHGAIAHATAPVFDGRELRFAGSRANLQRAIHNHREFKTGIYYPLLSEAYAWVVFDNLTLPDETLDALERLFFGAVTPAPDRSAGVGLTDLFGTTGRARSRQPRAAPLPRTVEVRELRLIPAASDPGTSTLTLRLQLENTAPPGSAGEYVSEIPLPPGVLVSGFRLHVNGTPVPGRIFERKTAQWVYAMIRDAERRDPGLLTYKDAETLELRVFPVTAGQPTVVEIDVLYAGPHAETAALAVAEQSRDPAAGMAVVERLLDPAQVAVPGETITLTGLQRLPLPVFRREPYVHLIIDRSEKSGYDGEVASLITRARALWPSSHALRVTLANHDVRDLPDVPPPGAADPGATIALATLPQQGGFAFDHAVAHALHQHLRRDLEQEQRRRAPPPRPVVVVISRELPTSAADLPLTDAWDEFAPDLEIHGLTPDGQTALLRPARLAEVGVIRAGTSVRSVDPRRPVRLPADGARGPGAETWSTAGQDWIPLPPGPAIGPGTLWSRGLRLHALQLEHARSPGDPAFATPRLVPASRELGILIPATSYIVVENAAQWRMLELSEQQKLGQPDALEFLETPAPPGWLVPAAFVLVLGLRHAWRRRSSIQFSATARRARPGRHFP